jgi:cyclopropane-fatty-acyl-phospholipid synthase
MRVSTCEKKEPLLQTALDFIDNLFVDYDPLDFSVRFWEGTTWGLSEAERPDFTLVIKHPGSLRRMFLRADQLSLGESFIYDDFDVEGDMEASFRFADYLHRRSLRIGDRLRLGRQVLRMPGGSQMEGRHSRARPVGLMHSRRRDAEAVTYHYNIKSEFYRLWLDRRMSYSCGYFQSPDENLDEAQAKKMAYVCRKLRLRPGERLLDIGCGWGSMVLSAARDFGVTVLGITLSGPQAEWANERIREAGLEKRCRVEVADYRDIDDWGAFDKLVSIGMFEHVGLKHLDDYFRRAYALLKPRGVFLNHGISQQYGTTIYNGPSFIDHYVFPDGELFPISTTLHSAEKSGFEVRDVESLREHYRLTLQHWVQRLEKAHDEAKRLTDEATYRIWRLFMAGSAHQFGQGILNLHQTLLVKPEKGASGLPLTRSDWYS